MISLPERSEVSMRMILAIFAATLLSSAAVAQSSSGPSAMLAS